MIKRIFLIFSVCATVFPPAVFPFTFIEKYVQIFFPQGEVVTAELALSEEERSKGLMFRKEMKEDQGMLFIFEEEGFHAFWMKNMSFSIDILWLDSQRRIVHIETRVPPCPEDPCPPLPPRYPSLYVLELKAGAVEAFGLHMFDRLEFVLQISPFKRSGFKGDEEL